MDFGRPFPQAVEAERALLGGLITDPGKLGDVAEVVESRAPGTEEGLGRAELGVAAPGEHLPIDD